MTRSRDSYEQQIYRWAISENAIRSDWKQKPFTSDTFINPADLGLYYLNSRFYDPAIGRFINGDTIELVLASQCTLSDKNLYAYCDNNPVMRRDESGAAWETVFDVISLGASIADMAANPANVWAWAGLAGDIADVAIPFIGGIGETIKCCGAVNKADNIIDVAKSGTPSVDIELKYKDGWTAAQKAEADAKVKALSNATTVKTPVNRGGTSAASKYKSAYGKASVPSGYDVDHTIDLQLGGADDILNMNPLDMSVNRSLGVQNKNAIKDYPDGTVFGQFTIQ